MYIPERGDIVWLDFDPQAGNEIKKTRPALIVSPKSYNKVTRLALVMPITSKVKNTPFVVPIKEKRVDGLILTDQLRSLDWHKRNAKKIATAPESVVKAAIEQVQVILLD